MIHTACFGEKEDKIFWIFFLLKTINSLMSRYGQVWIKIKQVPLPNLFLEDIIETYYLYPRPTENHMRAIVQNKELSH